MVSPRRKTEDLKRICPGCGSAIKLPASLHSRNVQCPKCRKVVALDAPGLSSEKKMPVPSVARSDDDETAKLRSRVDALEARVAAIEAVVKNPDATTPAPAAHTARLQWVSVPASDEPGISTVQESALCHNLSGIPRLHIAIRSAPGDALARQRADWFKTVFDRAKWAVSGPENATETPGGGLFLGVSSLPVTPEAAATFLALRAAGFPATAILDPILAATPDAGFALSLIVGSAEAA